MTNKRTQGNDKGTQENSMKNTKEDTMKAQKSPKVFKVNGLEVTRGNSKLGSDTLIINMGSATECPSRAKGLCGVGEKCYALKAEKMYPACKPYRDRQENYWKKVKTSQLIVDFETLFDNHKKALSGIKYLRFNESGDFWSIECIEKLNALAKHLLKYRKIITYGYTARRDLISKVDFEVNFNVKVSIGFLQNPAIATKYFINGFTKVILKGHKVPEDAIVCPGNCRNCDACKVQNKKTVVFIVH